MTRKFTSLVAAGLAAGAAFSAPAFAQRAMTIEDLFELRQVGGASVAPGGEHVAYTVVSPRNIAAGEADGVSRVHLHIAGADGEGRAYITGDMRVSGVAWRPGAGTVTFRDRRGDDTATGLYEIAVDGGEAQRLFAHSESIGAYAFGPEGETLWFVARPAADPMDATLADRGFRANVVEEVYTNAGLWRVDLSEGGEAERIEIDGHVSDVVVSGDGERVAALVAPRQDPDRGTVAPHDPAPVGAPPPRRRGSSTVRPAHAPAPVSAPQCCSPTRYRLSGRGPG